MLNNYRRLKPVLFAGNLTLIFICSSKYLNIINRYKQKQNGKWTAVEEAIAEFKVKILFSYSLADLKILGSTKISNFT